MKNRKIISFFLAALMIFALCSCGRSSSGSDSSMMAVDMPNEPEAADYSYDDSTGYGGFSAGSNELAAGKAENSEGDIDSDKIIYSADVTLETADFSAALEQLSALIEDYGGFVEASSIHGINLYSSYGRRSADYTIRIPSENFSGLMNALSDIGNVPYSHTYTENITAQYYDTQARLTAYETQEQSLLSMLEQAETVEDLISIEDKLTDVRYNIDSIKSMLKNWDRQVNYSTIALSVEEVTEYSPSAEISYGERLWLSLKNGLKSVGEFLSDFLVWLVGALPTLVILAILFIALRPLLRKWNLRRRERRAARMAERSEQADKN